MKAVLMNSADKIQGTLGMSRTLVDTGGNNWLTSEAYLDNQLAINNPDNGKIPLDNQMGTGHSTLIVHFNNMPRANPIMEVRWSR